MAKPIFQADPPNSVDEAARWLNKLADTLQIQVRKWVAEGDVVRSVNGLLVRSPDTVELMQWLQGARPAPAWLPAVLPCFERVEIHRSAEGLAFIPLLGLMTEGLAQLIGWLQRNPEVNLSALAQPAARVEAIMKGDTYTQTT